LTGTPFGNPPTIVPTTTATVTLSALPLPRNKLTTPVPSLFRHFEAGGRFSYIPPDGWELQDFPGLSYKVARGPTIAGRTPSMVVTDDVFSGSLDDYVKANLVNLQRYPGFSVVGQVDFQPYGGSRAIKLISVDTSQDERQTFYFFASPSKKFVVTCTRPATQLAWVDTACDQSMNTFRFEP
jgi:hypothetical protein